MVRLAHYSKKIREAWASGTLWKRAGRFVAISVMRPGEVLVGYARLSKSNRDLDLENGFADHRQEPGHHHSKSEHLARIIAAYKAAKLAERDAAPEFAIRGLWAEWISVHYKRLIAALEAEDAEQLGALLENYFREPFTAGMDGYDCYVRYGSPLGSLYTKYVWNKYRDNLSALGLHPNHIDFPRVGNPVGVMIEGNIISIETLRHAYHAAEMRELLQNVPGAVCVEIGGGTGGQAYQFVRLAGAQASKYVVFDIPEVAVLSSYFLLSALPECRVRLYGEGPVSVAQSEEYDLAVFPHFAVTQLADASVDLFFNDCSFSEMDGKSARGYLSVIERACRRYFLHDNHDEVFKFKNPDGTTSINVIGSELVPDPTTFKQVFKKARVHGLPEDRFVEQYEYLYENIRPRVPAKADMST